LKIDDSGRGNGKARAFAGRCIHVAVLILPRKAEKSDWKLNPKLIM
jgi:hypothetical protein